MASFWRRLWPQKSVTTLDIFREIYGGREAKTGKAVNAKTAIEVSAVFGCTRVIADGIAQVPLKLLRESADGRQRESAKDHPLYRVLHRRPNAWQTSFEFREMLGLHAVLCGNFFAFKNVVRGTVRELIPFEPGMVTVKRADSGVLSYDVRINNATQTFPAESIWHVRGPSWNSWMGLEAVQIAREAIGLAMATEESQARLHKHGVRPGGILSVEGALDDAQYKKLREWLDKTYEGSENAHKTFIADRKAQWKEVGMTGVDAQHLETRRYQVEEICRLFRVMPIMVGFSDKASTYASAEQMFLAHVVHTLAPWYERLEQSIDVNLLSEQDQAAGLYSAFIEEGLLRGDLKTTAEYLGSLTERGILTRNEARAKLDVNPLDGLDEPLTPANMNVGAKPEPKPAPAPAPVPDDDAKKRVEVHAHVTVPAPVVNVGATEVRFEAGAVTTTVERQGPDAVNVSTPDVKADLHLGEVRLATDVHVHQKSGRTVTRYRRDERGELEEATAEHTETA